MAYTNDTKDASGKSINDYKADYAVAAAKGDAAGMAAANAGANAIRTSNGGTAEYATADINNVAAGKTSAIVSNPSAWDAGSRAAAPSSNSGGASYSDDGGPSGSGVTRTTYTDANGNRQTGYIINGTTYKDAAGTTPIDYGSVVTTADGQTWVKGVNKSYTLAEWNTIHNISGWGNLNASVYGGAAMQQTQNQGAYTQQTQNPQAAQQAVDNSALLAYLKQQSAARIESALAGLKGAYEKSMAGYDDTLSRTLASYDNTLDTLNTNYDALLAKLPATYAAARNSTAAANALEKKAFDEQAAASGLNSGASGQAELARSSVYQGNLANINQAQSDAETNINTERTSATNALNAARSNAEADIALQKANLTSEYETAIAQARANGDADLAEALYQEMMRQQSLAREDDQLAQQYALELAQLGASVGDYSGYNGLGIDTSAYEAALAAANSAYTPTFSQAQVLSAAQKGTLEGNMLRDYNYYVYGDPDYTGGTAVGVPVLSAYGGGTSNYDNGGLTAAQIRELQQHYGVTADGLWGIQSQLAAGGKSAKEAWAAYQAENAGGTAQLAADTIGSFSYLDVPESAIKALIDAGVTAAELGRAVDAAEAKGTLTQAQAQKIADMYFDLTR